MCNLFVLLTVLFVALKLLGIITWSWWWVLGALWIPFALALGLLVIVGVFLGLAAIGVWLAER